jgi:anaerobic selenocysteine-containing dehydrogenase
VKAFPPEVAAERAGLDKDQLVAAARMFASGSKGCATTGTGPEMAGNGTLTEYLVTCLNTICARFKQEGEKAAIPGVFSPYQTARRAQVAPPVPMFGAEGMPKSRFRGLGHLGWEMPCNVLADEILTPGEGQVRALISVGGNPVVGFPDQAKMVRALDDLELFVQIDPWMSASAKRATWCSPPRNVSNARTSPTFPNGGTKSPMPATPKRWWRRRATASTNTRCSGRSPIISASRWC